MITVNGRRLHMPENERHIGFEGDNKIEERRFVITDPFLFDFNFKLDVRKPNAEIGIIDLIKIIEDDKIILIWEILREHLADDRITVQLRAFSGNDEIWHSNKDYFKVGDSINATSHFPSPLPSEFEQMEQRVTAAQADVIEKVAIVEQYADNAEGFKDEAEQAKQTAIEKAAEALQSAANALISEQNAKASEDNAEDSKQSAINAMETAVQAMQDLLAMLGTDIATLTDGKLTPSQVPAIAITDTFVVADEGAMLALSCETGDIAIRTDENKTYILQGTDPSDITHWQPLKSPTNYADTAGHAATADEAENASKINGHRVVYMTQAQYDNAVKDPETVYMVGD